MHPLVMTCAAGRGAALKHGVLNQIKAEDEALYAELSHILEEARRRIQLHASNTSHAKLKAKAKLEKDLQKKPAAASAGQEGRAKAGEKETGDDEKAPGAEAKGGKASGDKKAAKAKARGGRTGRAAAAAEAREDAVVATGGAGGEDIE